jgi:hypothetical protein
LPFPHPLLGNTNGNGSDDVVGGKGLLSWLGCDLESCIFGWFTLSQLLVTSALSHSNRSATFEYLTRASSLHVGVIGTVGDVKAFRMCQRLRSLTFTNEISTPNSERVSILQELLSSFVMHNSAILQVAEER